MTYTALFIVTLVAVSGLIAYLGDLLGRRMGKHRLTLFGLRPRHTAVVVTTITGMLIAGLTFATLIATSSSIRAVLMHGERLAKDNEIYQAKNKELHNSNVMLTAMSSRLSREVREKSKQVAAARKDAENALRARNEVRLHVKRLQSEIKESQRELVKLSRAGKLTEERLKVISASLRDRKKELASVRADLAKKDTELIEKLNDLVEKDSELAAKESELQDKEVSIARAEGTIKKHEALIQEQQLYLRRAVRLTDLLLTGDVVIQQGQELDRRVIDSSLSPSEMRAEFVSMLDEANDKARKADAGSNDGKSRSVQLVYSDKTTGAFSDDEKAGIDEAVDAIIEQGKDSQVKSVLAQLIVVNNTLKGEKALVKLRFYWNTLKFQRGQNIASRTIDGSMSEGRILLSVMDFLSENVRASAEKAGVVPVANPDPEEVGEPISSKQFDEVMELVENISKLGRKVEVRAIARKDIYAAGHLNLDSIGFTINTMISASR
ncbi:MAG: DUF3084 domain-containing protein [Armatimonadota bacterium]